MTHLHNEQSQNNEKTCALSSTDASFYRALIPLFSVDKGIRAHHWGLSWLLRARCPVTPLRCVPGFHSAFC